MDSDIAKKTYGIIGWPVKHSLSPIFQTRFLASYNIDAVYLPFAVAPELLAQHMQDLWEADVQGFNVTVPHKESILPLVEADADAQRIGAVNTVRRSAQGWQACNTDWRGFKGVVEGLGVDIAGKQALLFGAGGTSRAVLHALHALSVAKVMICNRNADRLANVMAFAQQSYPDLNCEAVPWQQDAVSAACQNAPLLINSTSIGLQAGQTFPFILSGQGMAMDAVYRPDGYTAFVNAAALAGRSAVDGLPMLVAQGAASFAWWHACDVPDIAQALHQMQQHLGREVTLLPGWVNS
ncbi:MAG: shikimate dehydrogenase [Mariprofundus sp.]|nr:shikimate dehydrogenase [Mariprofundus sp.]